MITILLPIRNEEKYIGNCLNSVLNQEQVQDEMEILVIDGMSEDKTREIVAGYQKSNPNIRLIDNPQKIVPAALNSGILQARGEFILRVDGHCVVAPNYVANIIQHLQRDDVDGVGGNFHSIGEDLLSSVIALATSSRFGVGNSAHRTETGQTMWVDTAGYTAYPRSTIRKFGLFDEELVRNQDDEYNFRVRAGGGKILLANDVHITYYNRGSLQKLWRQYYQYGFWKVRVLQKHPRQMSLRQFAPPLFVLSLFTALLLTCIVPGGWVALAALLLTYGVANLTASILTARAHGWHNFWLLPITFLTLHISYGFGFLVGLFKFWNRWGDRTGKERPFPSSQSGER